jgi:TIR domain
MTAQPADPFRYDVFLSYRHQEPVRSWVRQVLERRLADAGLRVCIDYRSFPLGSPLVLEMAKAVERSRYTLAVLSPAYLDGNFTELESVLAEHLGLEQTQRRLLAVMREPCRPRLGMRARLWLDMTDDAQIDDQVDKLVEELRRDPDA